MEHLKGEAVQVLEGVGRVVEALREEADRAALGSRKEGTGAARGKSA